MTYRRADLVEVMEPNDDARDVESSVFEFKPEVAPHDDHQASMLVCLVIGCGGWTWRRRRKRRKTDERRAIDAVFSESPRDDRMWT